MSEPAEQPLTQLLYRASLEAPEMRWMIFGPGLETTPPYINIGIAYDFIHGFGSGLEAIGAPRDDAFFTWLRDEAGAFPQQGWHQFLLEEAAGDHRAAMALFFGHLHRYLLDTRPGWFVRLNQRPLRSLFINGLGKPFTPDVRLKEHVAAITGGSELRALDLRFTFFENPNGLEFHLGPPLDMGSWWSGSGRRLVVMGTRHRLQAVEGSTGTLESLLSEDDTACALDATPEGVAVLARGGVGAIHVRDGHLVARTTQGTVAHWNMQAGDVVMLLSVVLFEHACTLGIGPLPPRLAPAEPIAWAQAIDSSARRLAVGVTLPER